jgi:serine/threonine protein kinase
MACFVSNETDLPWPMIRYAVEFPHFRRSILSPNRSVEIRVQSLNFSYYFLDVVMIPDYVQELEYCTAIVEISDRNFDKEQLVKDLIQFGCGKKLGWLRELPAVLQNDAKLTEVIEFSDSSLTGDKRITSSGNLLLLSDHSSAVTKAFFENTVTTNLPEPPSEYDMSVNQSIGFSPVSHFASPASFMSGNSPASFMTARSTYASPAFSTGNGISPAMRIATIREDEPLDPSMPAPLQKLQSDYYSHLRQQNIVQPFDKELNWSGKGQHVTFLPRDSVPLNVLSSLGASMTAKVEKVLCRRIALARKTMRCSRQWTIAEALQEVYHLQNLRHFHVVQLVGSYLQGRSFSILMYPVADCHLGTFLEDTADMGMPYDHEGRTILRARQLFLLQSMSCLTSAIAYIHEQTTKHMDIKPQNILVREIGFELKWRVYLADFGLSRNFSSQGHSQTDGPTSRTPRYCAPEVYKYEIRGRSADIFSLGCVFTEMLTVLHGKHPQDFAEFRRGQGDDESFHANLSRVDDWLSGLGDHNSLTYKTSRHEAVVRKMISYEPEARPAASTILIEHMLYNTPDLPSCCTLPPEQYVAYEELEFTFYDPLSDGKDLSVAGEGYKAVDDIQLFDETFMKKNDEDRVEHDFSLFNTLDPVFPYFGKETSISSNMVCELDTLLNEA